MLCYNSTDRLTTLAEMFVVALHCYCENTTGEPTFQDVLGQAFAWCCDITNFKYIALSVTLNKLFSGSPGIVFVSWFVESERAPSVPVNSPTSRRRSRDYVIRWKAEGRGKFAGVRESGGGGLFLGVGRLSQSEKGDRKDEQARAPQQNTRLRVE